MTPSDATPSQPRLADYLMLGAIQALFVGLLYAVVERSPPAAVRPSTLLGPVIALVALTGAVWLLMVLYRNTAILRGSVSIRYFHDYASDVPTEWLERPARTFNNLMQVPTLFYGVCLFMLATNVADSAQIGLAWLFVLTRAVHALAYIGWNRVPYRFSAYFAGCITLGLIWARFALQTAALGLW
jgi:hypothetical protein